MIKKSIEETVEIENLAVEGLGLLQKGIKVTHNLFGIGTIVAIFQWPDYCPQKYSVGVEFDSVGYKPLSLEYAKLKLYEPEAAESNRKKFQWKFWK